MPTAQQSVSRATDPVATERGGDANAMVATTTVALTANDITDHDAPAADMRADAATTRWLKCRPSNAKPDATPDGAEAWSGARSTEEQRQPREHTAATVMWP
jgi:hypothetical protein